MIWDWFEAIVRKQPGGVDLLRLVSDCLKLKENGMRLLRGYETALRQVWDSLAIIIWTSQQMYASFHQKRSLFGSHYCNIYQSWCVLCRFVTLQTALGPCSKHLTDWEKFLRLAFPEVDDMNAQSQEKADTMMSDPDFYKSQPMKLREHWAFQHFLELSFSQWMPFTNLYNFTCGYTSELNDLQNSLISQADLKHSKNICTVESRWGDYGKLTSRINARLPMSLFIRSTSALDIEISSSQMQSFTAASANLWDSYLWVRWWALSLSLMT